MAQRQSCWTYSARSLATDQNASAVAHLFRLWIWDSFEIEDAHNIERYRSVKRLFQTGTSFCKTNLDFLFFARRTFGWRCPQEGSREKKRRYQCVATQNPKGLILQINSSAPQICRLGRWTLSPPKLNYNSKLSDSATWAGTGSTFPTC